MKKPIVLSFTDFVNESRYEYDEEVWMPNYRKSFNDFDTEREVFPLVDYIKEKWQSLKKKYNWGRYSSDFGYDHFALNVKVYVWPDIEEARRITERPDLSEERLNDLWWKWFEDQREALVDNINYSWVKDVHGFGGRSGGWLIIEPDYTEADLYDELSSMIESYVVAKTDLEDDTIYAEWKERLADPEQAELIQAGLLEVPEEVSELMAQLTDLIEKLEGTKAAADQIGANIEEILAKVEEFRKNAVAWFNEYLKEEHEEGVL